MNKRILSVMLAIIMLTAMVGTGVPSGLAAAPTDPSFEVKHTKEIQQDGTLLFSEEPVHIIKGAGIYNVEAYVLPAGTKIALMNDGSLILLRVIGESALAYPWKQYGSEAYEITLTEEMSEDPKGVRIVSERGLMTVFVRDEWDDSPYEAVCEWNNAIFSSRSKSTAALEFYKKPSQAIQSKTPDITTQAKSIIEGEQSSIRKALAVHKWVTTNIWYDYDSTAASGNGSRDPQDAVTVLKNKRGLCEGYANLTVALLRAAGLPAIYVEGYVLSNDLNPEEFYDLSFSDISGGMSSHAWCEVYIDNRWVIMDPTWDCYNRYSDGIYQKPQTGGSAYFNTPISYISRNHRYEMWYDPFVTEVALPDGATMVSENAFYGCTSLTSITIPNSITDIRASAFRGCTGLASLMIPDSVTKIGANAFGGCPNLIIYSKAGSYAETYAKANNVPFRIGMPSDYPAETPRLSSAADWAKSGIQSAYAKGFIPADLQDNYSDVITRAEFCRMAVQWVEYRTDKTIDAVIADKGLTVRQDAFSDTNDPSILAAYTLGITSGTVAPTATTPGTFTPDGEFNRQQAAVMIMNTCKVIGMDTANPPISNFVDLNDADNWARTGINFVRANGIMGGTSTDLLKPMFSPKLTYTRQESIITFNNIK